MKIMIPHNLKIIAISNTKEKIYITKQPIEYEMVSRKVLIVLIVGILAIAAIVVMSSGERSDPLKFEDGSMSGLDMVNGSLVLAGSSGEWNQSLNAVPGRIAWDWDWRDGADFGMWVKVSFSDHNSIYYVADGSHNPDAQGEYYLDDQGRRRYAPAVIIACVQPGQVNRDLQADYRDHCGLGNAQVTGVEVDMAGFGAQAPDTRLLSIELIDNTGFLQGGF